MILTLLKRLVSKQPEIEPADFPLEVSAFTVNVSILKRVYELSHTTVCLMRLVLIIYDSHC